MSQPHEIVEVAAADLRFEPRPWRFAVEREAEIAAHWREALAEKPRMFDGRVLLQHRGGVERDEQNRASFRGAYLETSFSSFLAWRAWGLPPAGVRNGFGMAALRGSDGGFVLGEMAAHTANAGRIYFASGTPDPSDIVDGRVDMEGSIRRELAEETGLDPATLRFGDGMVVVMAASSVGFMKIIEAPEPAERLVERIHGFLAHEREPELCRMHVVRRAEDIGPAVQSSCAAFLRWVLGAHPLGTDAL